ncbi:MAG: glutamate--tRNA ligase [Acidimicrobiales bacterium]
MGGESLAGGLVRVRFAPSPTGFLHVGSARTALFNWLFARHHGGIYLLRIEDTDEDRNRKDWAEGILTALDWLGIPPDEPAVYQSSRSADHEAAIERLWEAGYLYACDCTREEVAARTKGSTTPGYDGHCRERNLQRAGNALRFRVPDGGSVVVRDLIRGDVEFPLQAIEDFVVVKSNGGPLFVLANVVDDRSMEITHVIRGEDLLPSAPKALLLWQALDGIEDGTTVRLPAYAHLPMLVNEKREKISKRRDDVAVESYRAQGYLPGAFTNYLALLGWGHPKGIEIFHIADAVPEFSLEEVHHAPAFFDLMKLRHVNSEHLRGLSAEAFVKTAMPWLIAEAEALESPNFEAVAPHGRPFPAEHFDPEAFRRIAPHVQQRVSTLSEVPGMVEFLFFEHPIIEEDAWQAVESDDTSKAILDAAIDAYEKCEFDVETLHAVTGEVAASVGRKLAKAQAPIRVAITGKRVGPPLFESMAILGREKVLERLRSARLRLDPAA